MTNNKSNRNIEKQISEYAIAEMPVISTQPLNYSSSGGLSKNNELLQQLAIQEATAAAETAKLNRETELLRLKRESLNNNTITEPGERYNTSNVSDPSGYNALLKKYESGGDYSAYNKSGATGAYQFFESTANPYLKQMNVTWQDFKKNPKIQDEVARRFTEDNKRILLKNGIKPTNIALYAMHQQGAGGGLDILKGGNKYSNNIAANLPKGMAPTSKNWLAYWSKKFG